ncbi:transglutaminaseTgpA domain-containing protein [Cytobacillus spongiae]|uniref:transglutaminase TgpA family protein n=1 Tax=Cytobacillus spongiae TaxID=2901381 RepID=UPI001F1CBED7|nr:transglutaminaseTgpA domain-containing protein [Cytobacillus spongiae]UII56317.1 transglutaminaseTgpA domain-containing protein [Cytobacillus spongiae]
MEQKRTRDLPTLFLYVFSFFLLWEWLRPVELLTDTSYIGVFLIFLSGSLLLFFLKVHAILRMFLKSLFILYALHYLYFEGSFFQLSWISLLVANFQESIGLIFAQEWESISNLFRSFLFFILLWLMTYLMEYWLINRRKIFLFFFMTLIYITVLDTFTPYEADVAIIRTVAIGFAVMGMLTFYRIIEQERLKQEFASSRKWMVPLAVMIGLSVVVGVSAPKADPIWPDPVPFIKSFNKDSGGDGGSTTQMVGYGTDDSSLGGPFVGNDQVVYRTEVESRQYWKVETKDVYTGKGWIESGRADKIQFAEGMPVPLETVRNQEEIEYVEEYSKIYTYKNYQHVVYPNGVKQIEAPIGTSFELDPMKEKIYSFTLDHTSLIALDEYSVVYDVPKYNVSALKSALSGDLSLSADFIRRYTQLPAELPDRVSELALEITKDKDNWYDQAKEIENYFNRNDYSYDQQNVAVPGEEDDYVDQFLFDSKRGYCDNFSTSMVVLLRSVGIPSRWVKGYTEGEYKQLADSGKKVYEITNNNAHSWVEVYFPSIGWVAFEPTQGFSNNVLINYDTASDSTSEQTQPEEKPEQDLREETEIPAQSDETISFQTMWKSIKQFIVKSWKWLVLILLSISLASFILYQKRSSWVPYVLIFFFKNKQKDDHFVKAYLYLLKQLEWFGLRRKDDQTLRDYAQYVDKFFSSKEMGKLTAAYERYLYKGQLQEGTWNDTKELWENLIKRTIA